MSAEASPAFISYSRVDSAFASRLARDLKKAGADVWLDRLDIVPGELWDLAVERALLQSPRILVILSPSSVKSQGVLDEVGFALKKYKTILPLLYLDCEIPFRLDRFQYVDFRADYDSVLEELLRVLPQKSLQVPQIAKDSPQTPDIYAMPAVKEEKPPDHRQTAIERIHTLTGKLGYWHVGPTRHLLDQIKASAIGAPPDVRAAAISGIRDFLMKGLLEDDAEATKRARGLRGIAFDVLKICCEGDDFARHFSNGEFDGLDLLAFDFSGMSAPKVSFLASFLVEANLQNATLNACCFEGAYIRNADFKGASLRNADFRDADWFNALNLTQQQLHSVKPGTLLPMPATIDALHTYLKDRYTFPFDSWTESVKTNLTAAWQTYLTYEAFRR